MRVFSRNILGTWYLLFQPLFYIKSRLIEKVQKSYFSTKYDRITQSIIGSVKEDKFLGLQIKSDIAADHRAIADSKRKNTFHQNLYEFNPLRLEDRKEKDKIKFNPIFFEEIFIKPVPQPQKSDITENDESIDHSTDTPPNEEFSIEEKINKNLVIEKRFKRGDALGGINLVVLHHGFQGTSLDMLNLKHYFSLKYPKNYYLCAKSNEENSEECIDIMGKKLAQEVSDFIRVYIPGNITRLSFVGHSMGGLIIRAALPHLQEYEEQMGCFLSISTPHLGVNKGDSKLVEFGIR